MAGADRSERRREGASRDASVVCGAGAAEVRQALWVVLASDDRGVPSGTLAVVPRGSTQADTRLPGPRSEGSDCSRANGTLKLAGDWRLECRANPTGSQSAQCG